VKTWAARRQWYSLLACAFLGLGVAVLMVMGTPPHPVNAASCAGKVWIGPPGGDWNTAMNWSPVGVPGPGDRACINAGDSPVFSYSTSAVLGVDDAGTLTISGGTLQLTDTANPSTFNVLDIAGGNFEGPADSAISGAVHFSSGSIQGSGTVNFASGASLAISGPSSKFLEDSRTLSLLPGSSATWTGTGPIYTSHSGASARINNAGSFTIQGDSFWYRTCAPCTPAFNNSGTLTKNTTTGQTRIDPQFNNTGTVQTQTGTLTLTGGDSGSESGTFSPSAGGSIEFGGGNYILGGSITGAGTVLVSTGSVDVNGSYNVGFNLTGGATNFNSSGTITDLGLSSGGNLSGSGTATVSGTATWTSATMRGTGTLAFASGASLAISGPSGKFLGDSRTLSLLSGSSATWTDVGPIQSMLGTSARINNGGTFMIQGDSFWYGNCAPCTPAFNNSGTLIKNTSTTAGTRIDPPFNNTGTVQVTRGVLTLNGGYSPSAGSITRVNIGGTTAQTQFGVLDIPSAVTFQGTLDVVTDAPFTPALGQQFKVVTYAGRTGVLANGNGRVVDAGLYYRQHYDDLSASSLLLQVERRLTPAALTPISVAEPTLLDTAVIANFADNEEEAAELPAQYSATISWPDGTTSSGRVVSDGAGGFNVLPELGGHHVDDPGGSISVAVVDSDIDGTVAATTSAGRPLTVTEVAFFGTGGFTVSGSEGTATAVQTVATFTDPGGTEALGEYAASIAWGDGTTSAGTISYDSPSQTFTVSGAHTYAEEGNAALTVTLSHNSAPAVVVSSSAGITDPTVSASGGLTVSGSEGISTAAQTVATFTDPGGAEAIGDYAATIAWGDGTTSPAASISYDPNTDVFAVSGAHTYAAEGNPTIAVTVTHDTATTVVVSSSAAITDPTVSATGGYTVSGVEGSATAAQTVATFTDPGGAEALVDYAATIAWGDGTTSAGTITFSAGAFTVGGAHTYAEESGPNTTVTVTVTHDTAPAVIVSSSAAITDPVVSATGGFTVSGVEGSATAVQTVATFTDPGVAEALVDYAATIAWGDGTTSAGTITFSAGTFTVGGAHTYAEEGTPSVIVTLTHDNAPAVVVSNSAAITDPAVSATGGFIVSGVEGSATAAQTVATFSDPGGAEVLGDYSATIAWGDGLASVGAITFDSNTHRFTVSGEHAYAAEGAPTISVTLTHDSAPTASASSSASIADLAVSASGGFTVSGSEGTATPTQTVATFSDPSGAEALGDYGATIAWGDGQSSAGSISYDPASDLFTVKGAHTYAEESGPNTAITVTLSHDSAPPAVVSSSAGIADPAIAATGGFTVAGSEGMATAAQTVATFSDPGGAEALGDYGASIAWGDGQTAAGTISYDAGTHLFTVSGAHTYAEEGTPTITVTLTHDTAPAVVVSSSTNIADQAVVATGAFTVSGMEGTSTATQTVATFTDPAGAEALGDYGASIAWGDGQTSTGVITNDPNTHLFTVNGGHSYAEEGTPTITVTLTHDSSPAAVASSTAGIADPAVSATGGFTVSGTAGTATTSQTVATFTDPGGADALGEYSAAIIWGDGQTSAGAIIYDPASNLFTVSGSNTYAAPGAYTIAVTINHAAASPSVVSSSASVTGPIQNTTSVVTSASSSVPVGGSVSDTATLAGGAGPTGTMTFKLFGPNDTSCSVAIFTSAKPIAGNGAYTSDSFTASSPGTYRWVAGYGGDTNNAASGGSCGDVGESVVVTKAIVGLATQASASVGEGGSLSDAAVVSGGLTPTGSLTFSMFGPNDPNCTGSAVFASTKSITGDGTYPSDAFSGTEEGVYRWVASYSGDANNSGSTTACSDTNESVLIADADKLAGIAAPVSPTETKMLAGTVATFTDTNNAAVAADFTATIDWGDGKASSGSVNGGTGKFTVTGSHLYDEGTFTVKVTLNDDSGGASVSVTRAIRVPDADVLAGSVTSISATERTLFSGQVATFTDKNSANGPADFNAVIAWGDGRTSPGIVGGGNGSFTVSGNHTYQEGGVYLVKVIIKDNSPGTAQAAPTRRIRVADYSLTATGTSLTEPKQTSFSAVVATLSDADPSSTATDYLVYVDWGDGSASAGTVTGTNPFSLRGTHTYNQAGVYTTTVYIIDNGQATATTTTSIAVS
jgi:hypothetical protein